VPEYDSPRWVIRSLFFARLDAAAALLNWQGGPVLDAGCGSGELLKRLVATVCSKSLHGIDRNVHLAELRISEDWRLERADLHALPYRDGFFEAVFCMDVLEHIDDLRPVLRELRRVLAPGGRLIVSIPEENAIYQLGRFLLKGTFSMDLGPGAGRHYWRGQALFDVLGAEFKVERVCRLPLPGPGTLFRVVALESRPLPTPKPGQKASIVIPAYEEERTIATLLERVVAAPTLGLGREIIVVDDGSGDATAARAEAIPGVTVLRQEHNRGKGAALRVGFGHASGDFVIVQDADLEYDPDDYPRLLEPLLNGEAQVVYGSRGLGRDRSIHSSFTFFLGGQLITWAANAIYGTRLSDEPTGYKAFRRDLLPRLDLSSERYEFCPEFTAKVARLGVPIVEVPARYAPRSKAEGKKIGWRDGLEALGTLWRFRRWTPKP
jgi:SAM-dependent methyltransferase